MPVTNLQEEGQGRACQGAWMPGRVTWAPGDPQGRPPGQWAYHPQPAGQAEGRPGPAPATNYPPQSPGIRGDPAQPQNNLSWYCINDF